MQKFHPIIREKGRSKKISRLNFPVTLSRALTFSSLQRSYACALDNRDRLCIRLATERWRLEARWRPQKLALQSSPSGSTSCFLLFSGVLRSHYCGCHESLFCFVRQCTLAPSLRAMKLFIHCSTMCVCSSIQPAAMSGVAVVSVLALVPSE